MLKQLRQKQGLTQLQMSFRLKVSLDTIRSYEIYRNRIKTLDLLKVAKAYQMDNGDILKYLELVSR